MPLTSIPRHNKVVELFNHKLETRLSAKECINSLKTLSPSPPFSRGWHNDKISSLNNLQNVSFAKDNLKDHFYLNLFLRALLLSSLVGVREISALENKNTALRHALPGTGALGHGNRIIHVAGNNNLTMEPIRNKRGNQCGEIEREKIKRQKKVARKHARENARNIRRNARKEVRETIRTHENMASSNTNLLEGLSPVVNTGLGAGKGAIAGGAAGAGAIVGGIGGAITGGLLSQNGNSNSEKQKLEGNHPHDKDEASLGDDNKQSVRKTQDINDNILIGHPLQNGQLMDVNQPGNENIPAIPVDVSHIPMLARFMPPLKYFDFLYNGNKIDAIGDIEDAIRLFYQTEHFHMHSFYDKIDTIPEEYEFLREIAPQLKIHVEAAKNYVRSALHRFKQAIEVYEDVNDRSKIILVHKTRNGYIVDYFSRILNTQDTSIINQALERFYNALITMRNFFNNKMGKFIFASAKRNDVRNPVHNENGPMGFVMSNDQEQRVIIMADQFSPQYLKTTKPQITALHETSHHAVATRDFVLSPTTTVAGDALDFVEAMQEALFDEIQVQGEKTTINFDLFFMQAYGNVIGDIPVTAPQIKEMAKRDPILRANIMMDNADFLARMIFDIGQGIAYDSGVSLRTKRNAQSDREIQKMMLSKTVFFLCNRINADYRRSLP
ncbi:Putative cytotoxic necrotizing factor 1 [Sodalis praecaptivus]|uniref:Putative cytotoxic necrotizing factor 1 n=1 Tax=Sodalis praecaptivus TaxID=1239307 RepID=W0HYG3_9GAMM|nr:hypothetical protein [Sodalis praecaptivus]AHF77188.1 Putative cytotoxic necrotizing factor 1 [Sodalis praecaptivus]